MEVGKFWGPSTHFTPEEESDSTTTDPDSSKLLENLASPSNSKVPISDLMSD
jgi:hypothetical protein